ncbi:hypothetical protein F503_01142 [Ophiostoma piceae UAMH 11346]|uniref:Uncharacterized protein n=1 Tax=Ophiostoma piceae (strain UAMH 11346) TaxID=1262450 RepID=S3C4C5_OPHP1|nr:hypothetical protein F503_01142 [Ophiostoma piceae UAMH 11346]
MSYYPDQRGRASRRSDGHDNGYHVYDKPSTNYRYNSSSSRIRDRDGRDHDRDYESSRRAKSQGRYPAPVVRQSRTLNDGHRESRDLDRHNDRHYDRHSSASSSSSRRSNSSFSIFGDERDRELKHVVTSALTAGAVEAFRLRKSPGTWAHDKAGRVATAAIGAAVADTAAESKNPRGKHSRRHVVEATMAGLLTDRLVNGSRKK